mgnify:CR=1 FL=1
MLLMSLILLLKYEAPEYEQNFEMVLELLRAGEVKEDEDDYESPLDTLFKRIEENIRIWNASKDFGDVPFFH